MARSQTVAFFIIIRFGLLFGVLGGERKELEEYFKWKQMTFASDQYGRFCWCKLGFCVLLCRS